jgi:putative tryptophan/tyrosine transport system substrate-binding protein
MVAMRRREFMTLLGGAAAASSVASLVVSSVSWPFAARAQEPALPVIGFLNGHTPADFADLVGDFRRGLNDAGYVEGRNVSIEYRWAEGQYDRLPALAADLVSKHVAVIIGSDNPSALAAKNATTTIPIVFTSDGSPVALGLVTSLNRPGGNVTGVGLFSGALAAKRLGLLRKLVPGAQVVAMLADPKSLAYASLRREAQEAARALGIKLIALTAGTEGEVDAAFAALVQQHARALMVSPSPYFTWSRRDQIIALAARHAVPAIYPVRRWVAAGGLMSYGTILSDTYHQVGLYAAKILKGASPADLPVEQSSRFEYVINGKTAKTLGLDIPPKLLALADEVIE